MFQKEVVYHRGEQHRIRKKMKSLYIRTTKCPNRHKNLDYRYLLNKYSPKTQNFDVFFTLWMRSLIKMQKLNNWPKWFKAMGKKKALSLKILSKDVLLFVHRYGLKTSITRSLRQRKEEYLYFEQRYYRLLIFVKRHTRYFSYVYVTVHRSARSWPYGRVYKYICCITKLMAI